MKTIHFEIDYHTRWGEHIEVVYSVDGGRTVRTPLETADGSFWNTSLQIGDSARHLRHAYIVTDDEGRTLRTEPNSWRMFHFNHRSEVFFADTWADRSLSSLYHRIAFSRCIMQPRGGDSLHMAPMSASCMLLLHALPPADGLKWAVVGSGQEWGEWNPRKARVMQRTDTYEWCLPLTRADFERGTTYKYILLDPLNPEKVVWEGGENRTLATQWIPATSSVVRQDEVPRMDLPGWKGAGCVVPVFSLRSKGSFGVGDFGDLKLCVRWAADTGLKAVQLLPINDTTRSGSWHDSYPYNGISVFALHPIYLDPRPWKQSKAYALCAERAVPLNELPELDYEGAFALKMEFARALFAELGTATLKSAAFKEFATDNAHWLEPYTRFCALRDHFGTANFRAWPHKADSHEIAAPDLTAERQFYGFMQFLLHRQMLEVHNEARRLGVLLKGDIPIGVCPDSVPAWHDGRLFHFDGQAGAPPDDFAVHGQNWGFPTYNWDEMAKDGYLWWRRRLGHMEHYFDAYRIDHVLGFFRIWEIPSPQIYGVLGHFRPALPLTEEEIRQFGFQPSPKQYSRPQVSAERMQQLMAAHGPVLLQRYFAKDGDGYTLHDTWLSQRNIESHVPEGPLRELLLDTVAEVLFLPDGERPDCYHPRIAAQLTQVFGTLSESDKQAFNRLHDNFYYHRHNQFWADEAMKKIPIVTQSRDGESPSLSLYPLNGEGMLPCAEDLGMVPASVKGVLQRLGILSLEIQRMPKEYGVRFGRLENNPYLSVATIATHDMPPLRLWWTENREQTQAFWHDALGHEGTAPEEATPEVCEEVIRRHIQSPSMLCLLALQDLLAISPTLRSEHPEQEQINVPANPNQYWRYRMHLTLEQLIQATAFNEKLRGLVTLRE